MTTQRALSVVVLTIVTIIAVLYGYAYLNRKNREGYFRVAGTSLASLRTLWLKEGAAWPPPDAARYTGNAKLAGRAIALDTNIYQIGRLRLQGLYSLRYENSPTYAVVITTNGWLLLTGDRD
jgi:hypothetical protein